MTAFAMTALLMASVQCASLMKKVFDPPQVSVERVEFSHIDLTGVDLVIHVKLNNPNSVSATLKNLEYQVDIDGERLARGTRQDKIEIKSNDLSRFSLPISVSYAGLKMGLAGVMTKKELPFLFIGKLTLDTPIGDLSFDLKESGNIPIPDRPQFEIEKIALTDFGVTSATLSVHLKITNNHDIALDIKKFNYHFSIQDQVISAADISIEKSLKQDKSMSIALPINIQLLGIKRGIIDMLKSGKVKYYIKFDLDLSTRYGPFTIPYERDGLTTLY